MTKSPDIVLEKSMQLDFLEEISAIPGGEKLKECIQCGTCSGSCPTSYMMDHSPRQVFAMIRAGLRDQALACDAIWLCASCYMCTVRCPAGIKITDVMYALKRLAIKEHKTRKGEAHILSTEFVKTVNRYGRNFEPGLAIRYFLKASPGKLFGNAGFALRLLRRGRMPLRPKKIKGINGLRRIIRAATTAGGDA